MKYIAIDIETTGLDPEKNQIIEFAAVLENTENTKPIEELPYYSKLVLHERYTWDNEAFRMNRAIWDEILEEQDKSFSEKSVGYDGLIFTFYDWLLTNGFSINDRIVVAGKNFTAFDLQFIKMLPHYNKSKFHHRTLDPTMLFLDFKLDNVPPSLSDCLKRANLDHTVKHRALGDCRQVIQLLRTKI